MYNFLGNIVLSMVILVLGLMFLSGIFIVPAVWAIIIFPSASIYGKIAICAGLGIWYGNLCTIAEEEFRPIGGW
jgi:hypothetical protein